MNKKAIYHIRVLCAGYDKIFPIMAFTQHEAESRAWAVACDKDKLNPESRHETLLKKRESL